MRNMTLSSTVGAIDLTAVQPVSFELFGREFLTPSEWVAEKFKTHLADLFIDYLTVSPIVIGVSAAVYFLVGMFSKTLAKLGVVAVVLYSGVVFLFA